MSLLGLSPKLCLRALPTRPATRLCRATACRTFTASALLLEASKPAKRPGFLSRIKWYKDGEPRRSRAPGSPLTMYEELPPTYRDREGLPFAKHDLTPAEVAKVFGPRIKPEFANNLLRILHGRRVAGTLEDPAYKANTARFTGSQKEAALKYLRASIAVDETMNKGLRAQDELEQLEKEIAGMKDGGAQADGPAAKQGAAAAAQASDTAAKEQAAPQEEPEPEVEPRGNPAYGVSALDRIRARNIARIRAEEKRIEEERKEKGEPVAGTLEAYVDRGAVSPRMEKWQREGGSGLEEPPQLTRFERLAPSLTFGALLVAACLGYAAIYEPPEDHDRVFWDISPEHATIGTLIAINCAVYALWKVPPMWRFLNRQFMLVVAMPRPITILTAQFSHQGLSHLAMNMAALYYIGCRLHEEVGRGNFLALYLGSGTIGYMAGVTLHGLGVASLGASASVLGVTAAYFYMHAWDKFRIFGFPAAPSEGADGWVFLASVLLWNALAGIMPAAAATAATADIVSHMGGLLAGMGLVHVLRDFMETFGGKGGSGSGSKGAGAGEGRQGEQGRGVREERKSSLDLWGAKHWN